MGRTLNLMQVFDNHCEALNYKSDLGYVVACEGTKRSCYLADENKIGHEAFDYDEDNALIFQRKQDACNAMVDQKDGGLWKHLRIIPLADVWYVKGGKFPTVNGF